MRIFERLTVLIIPSSDAEIISLRLPGGALALFFSVFLAGLVGLGTCAFQYVGQRHRDATISQLRNDNGSLGREVSLIRDSITRLGGDLDRLAEFEREIRVASGLPAIDPQVARLGIGGPAGVTLRGGLATGAVMSGAPCEVDRDEVEQLLRQARFRRASLAQVAQVLTLRKETLERTPSILPISGGRVTSHFGTRADPFTGEEATHEGVDVSGPRGAEVVATAAGVVVATHARTGYGLTIEIDHENGIHTIYCHNSKVYVRPGDCVARGAAIAAVGSTGRATSPHCHYEVHEDGSAVDPSRFILSSKTIYD